MSKFAAFVNSVIWSWTHFRGLNDIKKFASIGVPLDDEDERHQISKTLPTAQQIQELAASARKILKTTTKKCFGKYWPKVGNGEIPSPLVGTKIN